MGLNLKMIFKIIANLVFIEGLFMVPVSLYGFFIGEIKAAVTFALLASMAIIFFGYAARSMKHVVVDIKTRESYFLVLICWVTAILVAVFPYYLCGEGYRLIDCIFESVSSWATCNAWVIDINSMPQSIILWKALSSWLGGMGVIILAILLMSALGISGEMMANAEFPGPQLEKTKPRMFDVAKITYMAYFSMSLAEFILLLFGGLDVFDALTNTMTSISTSGVIDYKGHVTNLGGNYVPIVMSIFSVISSLNFFVYIKLMEGKFKEAFLDYESRFFVMLVVISSVIIGLILKISGTINDFAEAMIKGFVGTVSYSSTTGFGIDGINDWPSVTKLILFTLMIIGGCANSTSGGIKAIRFIVFVKLIKRGIYKRIHPKAIRPVMIKNTPISAENASSISTFLILFFGIYLFATLILSIDNFDMETTLTSGMALLTNTGTGFATTADGYYGNLSGITKMVSSILMVTGRLEMYAILVIFSRSFWNDNRSK